MRYIFRQQRQTVRTALAVRLALSALVFLSGCVFTPPNNQNVETLTGPAPTRGATPMDCALRCLSAHMPRNLDLRLAVNDLTDGTGSAMGENSLSKVLTQRPDVMMTIGLAKTGVRLVNRSSTGVAEWELRQSMQKYIGDERTYLDPVSKKPMLHRPVMVGTVLGSTHYISGALTELNWNIFNDVNEIGIGGLIAGKRRYRISLAVDLIVTNTRTTEIVIARSYTKQLVGQEVSAGLFRFFDVGSAGTILGPNESFEFNVGREVNEPVQAAVRWMLETAAYDIVAELIGVDDTCDGLVPEGSRPVRPAKETPREETRPAPPPAARSGVDAAAAGKAANVISGVNLLDDDGAIVVRVDTQRPLASLPAVASDSPKSFAIDFEGVRNGVGGLAAPAVEGVSRVTLQDTGRGSRITVELKQGHTYRMAKEGRSLIIRLLPTVKAGEEALSPAGAMNGNGAPAKGVPRCGDNKGPGCVSGAEVLEPHETSTVPPDEVLMQVIRPR